MKARLICVSLLARLTLATSSLRTSHTNGTTQTEIGLSSRQSASTEGSSTSTTHDTSSITTTPASISSTTHTSASSSVDVGAQILKGLGSTLSSSSDTLLATSEKSSRATTRDTKSQQITPAVPTTLASLHNSNSTANNTNQDAIASSAWSCIVEQQAFTINGSNDVSIGTTVSTFSQSYVTVTETSFLNTYTYTLCDGYPRIGVSGSKTQASTITTASPIYNETTIVNTIYSTRSPPCTVPSSVYKSYCTELVESYNSSLSVFATNTAALEPPFMTQCADSLYGGIIAEGDDPNHADCYLDLGGGQLYYWPIETRGSFCNQTTIAATPTGDGPNTVVVAGQTITSPSVAISFSSMDYIYTSGTQSIYSTLTTFLIFPPDQVSSQCGYHGGFSSPLPFNYGDLNTPVPYSAWYCANNGAYEDPNGDQLPINTVRHPFNPRLYVPSTIFDLVSNFPGHPKSCTVDPRGFGFFDPPQALTKASSAALPTVPVAAPTTSAAVPQTQSAQPSSSIRQPAQQTDQPNSPLPEQPSPSAPEAQPESTQQQPSASRQDQTAALQSQASPTVPAQQQSTAQDPQPPSSNQSPKQQSPQEQVNSESDNGSPGPDESDQQTASPPPSQSTPQNALDVLEAPSNSGNGPQPTVSTNPNSPSAQSDPNPNSNENSASVAPDPPLIVGGTTYSANNGPVAATAGSALVVGGTTYLAAHSQNVPNAAPSESSTAVDGMNDLNEQSIVVQTAISTSGGWLVTMDGTTYLATQGQATGAVSSGFSSSGVSAGATTFAGSDATLTQIQETGAAVILEGTSYFESPGNPTGAIASVVIGGITYYATQAPSPAPTGSAGSDSLLVVGGMTYAAASGVPPSGPSIVADGTTYVMETGNTSTTATTDGADSTATASSKSDSASASPASSSGAGGTTNSGAQGKLCSSALVATAMVVWIMCFCLGCPGVLMSDVRRL